MIFSVASDCEIGGGSIYGLHVECDASSRPSSSSWTSWRVCDEIDDDRLGFIAAGDLNAPKSRVLLQLALTETTDPDAVIVGNAS